MTDEELLRQIADYLARSFIGDPKDLPPNECMSEAKFCLDLVKTAGYVKLPPNRTILGGMKIDNLALKELQEKVVHLASIFKYSGPYSVEFSWDAVVGTVDIHIVASSGPVVREVTP